MPEPPPLVENAALFLDFDGTLVEFAAHPDDVRIDAELVRLLQKLSERQKGAVAIVSGRSIETIDGFTRGAVVPVAGLHGAERRDSRGKIVKRADILPQMSAAKEVLRSLALKMNGVVFEDKGAQAALHYRGNPEAAEICWKAAQRFAEEASDIVVHGGNMVVELRTHGVGKDVAISEFMNERPFAGRIPVFIGDDTTDEDGFRYVDGCEGVGILAGALRPTAAHHHLGSVGSVRSWLSSALAVPND